jgi:hypothetical protein
MTRTFNLTDNSLPGRSVWHPRARRAAAACAVALWMPAAVKAENPKAHVQQLTVEQFQAHVKSLRETVDACRTNTADCDAAKVGDDDRVASPNFQMHWDWLRKALADAHSAKPADRDALLKSAGDRLDEMAKQSASPAAQFSTARADANRILDSAEFRDVDQPSWWDRKVASFWLSLQRGLSELDILGSLGWLGTLLEWLLFGGAAIGLLLFVRRNLQRQRLAVMLNSRGEELAWKRDSTDWAEQAEASARSGDWRDAVHCLYWATIVMLEGRRAWRHNPARTPREYVRLLKPGSPQHGALRGLTQIFERLWYGLRDAGPADYARARALYEGLRDKASAEAA